MIKVYIICYVPAQMSYLWKIWCLVYGPKCSWPVRLQDFQISYISRTKLENCLFQMDEWCKLIFLHIDTNSGKL